MHEDDRWRTKVVPCRLAFQIFNFLSEVTALVLSNGVSRTKLVMKMTGIKRKCETISRNYNKLYGKSVSSHVEVLLCCFSGGGM